MSDGQTPASSARELARAAAGAAVFALPMLMTMEMWWLGFTMDGMRLALFLALTVLLLAGLSFYSGMRDAFDWRDSLADACTAIAIGAAISAAILTLFGVIGWATDSPRGILGKIVIQAVPAAMGAVLAREQFGQQSGEQQRRKEAAGYFGSLFLMGAGALYLSFNLAPTQEMALIAYKMSAWHGIGLALLSMAALHAFVYEVGFHGQESREGASFWGMFLRYSVAGYAVTLGVSLCMLWAFGRIQGMSPPDAVMVAIVLAFPGALGAAVARLVL